MHGLRIVTSKGCPKINSDNKRIVCAIFAVMCAATDAHGLIIMTKKKIKTR